MKLMRSTQNYFAHISAFLPHLTEVFTNHGILAVLFSRMLPVFKPWTVGILKNSNVRTPWFVKRAHSEHHRFPTHLFLSDFAVTFVDFLFNAYIYNLFFCPGCKFFNAIVATNPSKSLTHFLTLWDMRCEVVMSTHRDWCQCFWINTIE